METVSKPYKYRIGFTQSSKGVVYFDATIHFDDIEHSEEYQDILLNDLESIEKKFQNRGYTIASAIVEPEPKK